MEDRYKKKFIEHYTEEENPKSVIGAGLAHIYMSDHISGYYKHKTEIFVAKDLESGIDLESKGKDVCLVVDGPIKVLWAVPIINGKLQSGGMYDGRWVYSSNDIVMKGYRHPIRLMDRFEHGLK